MRSPLCLVVLALALFLALPGSLLLRCLSALLLGSLHRFSLWLCVSALTPPAPPWLPVLALALCAPSLPGWSLCVPALAFRAHLWLPFLSSLAGCLCLGPPCPRSGSLFSPWPFVPLLSLAGCSCLGSPASARGSASTACSSPGVPPTTLTSIVATLKAMDNPAFLAKKLKEVPDIAEDPTLAARIAEDPLDTGGGDEKKPAVAGEP